MNSNMWFVDKASAVSNKKLVSRFERFRYALVSGDKNVIFYGLVELERRHAFAKPPLVNMEKLYSFKAPRIRIEEKLLLKRAEYRSKEKTNG